MLRSAYHPSSFQQDIIIHTRETITLRKTICKADDTTSRPVFEAIGETFEGRILNKSFSKGAMKEAFDVYSSIFTI